MRHYGDITKIRGSMMSDGCKYTHEDLVTMQAYIDLMQGE